MDFIEFEKKELRPAKGREKSNLLELIEFDDEDVELAAVIPFIDNFDYVELEGGELNRTIIEGSFDHVEIDEVKRIVKTKGDFVRCDYCGTLNRKGTEFCRMCQMEIADFRVLEVGPKPVKVKLTMPKNTKYIFCPICGAPNPLDADYCKDCTSPIEKPGNRK